MRVVVVPVELARPRTSSKKWDKRFFTRVFVGCVEYKLLEYC